MEKEHILREIKRTAEENDGKPLGQNKFASETGIKRHEWGRYWVKWSDALHGAGFGPNQWSHAYDESELLEYYARLARELGRLPVDGDTRMKSCGSPGFPSTSSFARLGGKGEIVSRLYEYCRAHKEHVEIIPMCEEYSSRNQTVPERANEEHAKTGFVYLMKSGRFYKIGRSDAPGRRQYDLAIQLPEEVKLVHTIPTEAPEAAERFWHERFKAKRKCGEWFDLSAADVKAFRRCKSM